MWIASQTTGSLSIFSEGVGGGGGGGGLFFVLGR